jgi:hypothetical protein
MDDLGLDIVFSFLYPKEENMPNLVYDIFSLLGFLLRTLGFLVIGFGLARFTLDSYKKAVWQLQIALVLGFFGLLIAITDFASAGSAGAFALGAGAAFVMPGNRKKEDDDEEEDIKKKK